jgi:hypothetical protein
MRYMDSRICVRDRNKVIDANRLWRSLARVLALACLLRIPWCLENPDSSRIFLTHEMSCLIEMGASLRILDQCQYGTPWKKRTRFVLFLLPFQALTCRGDHGLCSATLKRHIILSGRHPCGAHWISLAESYPVALCEAIATTFKQACQYTN